MDRLYGCLVSNERQNRVVGIAVSDSNLAELSIDAIAERNQQLFVERAATSHIRDRQVEMIELEHSLACAA